MFQGRPWYNYKICWTVLLSIEYFRWCSAKPLHISTNWIMKYHTFWKYCIILSVPFLLFGLFFTHIFICCDVTRRGIIGNASTPCNSDDITFSAKVNIRITWYSYDTHGKTRQMGGSLLPVPVLQEAHYTTFTQLTSLTHCYLQLVLLVLLFPIQGNFTSLDPLLLAFLLDSLLIGEGINLFYRYHWREWYLNFGISWKSPTKGMYITLVMQAGLCSWSKAAFSRSLRDSVKTRR